jgi:hypothetical protein
MPFEISKRVLSRWTKVLIVAVLTASVCSCSGKASVHPASGTVTFQGKPAVKAVIVLRPATAESWTGPMPHGEVGEDGVFYIGTYADADGAPAGDYTVTITWPETHEDPMTHDTVTIDRLGGRYKDPTKSTWKITIKDGDNELAPFRVD